MITVQEAKALVKAHVSALGPESRTMTEAVGYVLAEAVVSPLALPSFRQSSMDGYAVHHADITQAGARLPVVAESQAGTDTPLVLRRGTAVHILTGAPVPEGATAVVMREKAVRTGQEVSIEVYPVQEGKDIRAVGQQIRKGDVAMPPDTYLTPGSVGFLCGMNVLAVSVYRKPRVGILVTGDELVQPGNPLRFGQVYEANSSMLVAVLRAEGVEQVEVRHVPDHYETTRDTLRELTERFDVVLTTGGVSVGQYDFVGTSLDDIGAERIFYKVRQRPGKPLYFGRKGGTWIFGLPGNPAATLVCYYQYVLPALRLMYGRKECFLPVVQLPVTQAYSFQGERDEFLKAVATPQDVTPLDGQESFVLRSFAIANALIHLPASRTSVQPGEVVEAHLLPFFC